MITWIDILFVGVIYYTLGFFSGMLWRYADDLEDRNRRNA